jgi:hypothetical protein
LELTEILCSFCSARLEERRLSSDAAQCKCPRCGHFSLSGTALAIDWAARPNFAVLSYTVRRMQRQEKKRPFFMVEDIEAILRTQHLPAVREQADNLIIYLGDTLGDPAAKKLIDF